MDNNGKQSDLDGLFYFLSLSGAKGRNSDGFSARLYSQRLLELVNFNVDASCKSETNNCHYQAKNECLGIAVIHSMI